MIPIPHSFEDQTKQIPFAEHQASNRIHQHHPSHHPRHPHPSVFNNRIARSDTAEWLDVEASSRKPQPANMVHSLSNSSQSSENGSISEYSSQAPFYPEQINPPKGQQQANPVSPNFPSVIRPPGSNLNNTWDSKFGVENVGPRWETEAIDYREPQRSTDASSELNPPEHLQLSSVRISKACVPCRERRVRCQGGHPYCTSCIEKGRTDSCVYRVIPPRTVTRKNLEELQTRLERAEDQLQSSHDDNRELRARLREAEREVEKLKSGEKVRELEKTLREIQLRLNHNLNRQTSPLRQRSPSQGSDASYGTAGDPSVSPSGSPLVQPVFSPSDHESNRDLSLHRGKRPQADGNPKKSPYSRPLGLEGGNRRSISQKTGETGAGGQVQGQIQPNRRRAATTTSTVSPNPSLYTSIPQTTVQGHGHGQGLNISFDRGDQENRRNDDAHHQPHSLSRSSNYSHQNAPRSQSVSGGSTFSPTYPASPNSLPLPTPPALDLRTDYLVADSMDSRAGGSPVKPDTQLEPCYLQPHFNFQAPHPTSNPLDIMRGSKHKFQYFDPASQTDQGENSHHHHEARQDQASAQNQEQYSAHSHSQSLPSSQFTFRPQFIKHSPPQFNPHSTADSGVNLQEHHPN